ncbi:MAG: hypothetical protein IJ892_12405 [Prevotella sp.]|nr:hypothetical protein [Prevotella sp.]
MQKNWLFFSICMVENSQIALGYVLVGLSGRLYIDIPSRTKHDFLIIALRETTSKIKKILKWMSPKNG